jgi:superfamily II DNA or RNA helicase
MSYYTQHSEEDSYDKLNQKHEFNEHVITNKRDRNLVYLEPHQLYLRNYLSKYTPYDSVLIYHNVGSGKCNAKDTPILMHDGSIKMVQDITEGELLMGDDSTPRRVMSLARGEDEMYDIISNKGEKYTVNKEHILCLKASGFPKLSYHNNSRNKRFNVQWVENNKFQSKIFSFQDEDTKIQKEKEAKVFLDSIKSEQIIEISVKDYLNLSGSKKKILKGYRTKVEFPEKELPIDPYKFGCELMNSYQEIPNVYKCNSRSNRLKLLAGIFDHCDTLKYNKNGSIKINVSRLIKTHLHVIQDIIYIARSLGFACYKKNERICISGPCIEEIPTLIPRKKADVRKQKKDVLVTGIKVESVGRGDYYGFTLDGNCRYILGDFTVTHNTCTSIAIAEGFKEYINNLNRKVIVLVKNKNILKNFTNELQTECASGYVNLDMETEEAESAEIKKRRIQKEIMKNYHFYTYGSFVNKVLGQKEFSLDKSKRKRKVPVDTIDFSNTVVIVDEAHNVTGNDVYTALYKVLKNSYNYRLVLLTATPVYDNPKEIFELANLLDPTLDLPTRRALLKSEEPLITREISSYIDNSILKGGIFSITDKGKEMLRSILKGRVSHLQYNPETFPDKQEIGNALTDRLGSTKVVLCQMSDYQYQVYRQAMKDDKTSEQIDEDGDIHVDFTKVSSLYKNSSDASTMVYPESLYGKDGFLAFFEKKNKRYRIKYSLNNSFLTKDLSTYSTKLNTLLINLKQSPGSAFVFSHYVSYGGTTLLAALLSENGFVEYSKKMDRLKPSFVIFDDSISLESREKLRKLFNSPENKNGDIIKVIIGSPVMSEGITLKNVRQVHILEPAWNMSRIEQIIGRAFRNYSHADLEPENRKLEVFKYVSVYEKERDSSFFIDLEKYILSEEKDRSNKIVERILKEISVDCFVNKPRNVLDKSLNNTSKCDYTTCDYTCDYINESSNVKLDDKSTFNYYIDFFANYEIDFVSKMIPTLFKQQMIWTLGDIVSTIRTIYPVNIESIYYTLNTFISGRISIQDSYERDGFIIQAGPYFIFNADDLDVKSSIFTKTLKFSELKNKYSLEEYMLNKFFSVPSVPVPLVSVPSVPSVEKQKDTRQKKRIEESIPDIDKYNQEIINKNDIYGTYYGRLGKKDAKFRIVDQRIKKTATPLDTPKPREKDKRKIVTGMVCSSFKKGDLINLVNELNIQTEDQHTFEELEKDQLCNMIEEYFHKTKRVLA